MAQCVSHMRQRVGTTPDGTTVLTFIADVILYKTGLSGSAFGPFFPFKSRQFVDVAVMQRTGHAVLNTLRITRTQIALGGNLPPSFEMDATERTGMDARMTAGAQLQCPFRYRRVVLPHRFVRTGLHTGRFDALTADDGQ